MKPMERKRDTYYSIPLEKGVRILNLFTQNRELTLQEVSEKTGLTKTSAFRFCNTLTELNYLKKDPRTKLLTLGTNAFILGSGLIRGFDLYQVVKPFIDDACNMYRVAADSCVFDGESFTVLYRREVSHDFTYYRFPISKEFMTCTALGKATLAFLPQEQQLRLVKSLPKERRTEKTLLSVKDIIHDLNLSKKRGYALNNQEFINGFLSIAAPIFNHNTGNVIGAVCFDFTTVQYDIKTVERDYGAAIMEVANSISQAIHDRII